MTRPVQGINATIISDLVSALHGPILGPEAAYAAITFKTPPTDDSTIIYHEFVQHAGALRFAESADIIASQLKHHSDTDRVNRLINTVSLPDAVERMHDTIRELAVNSSEHIREVELKAIIPLRDALAQLQKADDTATRTDAWHKLRKTIASNHIIPLLMETNHFLHFAGNISQKRRVIFGARPDTGPKTKHFELVREFLHNISNGLLPLTLEMQRLMEMLTRLPAERPEADSFDEAVDEFTHRIVKWYKAYESGMLTLHRYFIFDGLEKANRQVIVPSVELLAQAAAASRRTPLEMIQLQLQKQDSRPDPVAPLREQRDQLVMLLENIAGWHVRFELRSPETTCLNSQARLLIDHSRQAIVFLSKVARFFPAGTRETISEFKLRRFYSYLGKFKAIPIAMAKKFDGWDSRREAHMSLDY